MPTQWILGKRMGHEAGIACPRVLLHFHDRLIAIHHLNDDVYDHCLGMEMAGNVEGISAAIGSLCTTAELLHDGSQ